MGRLTGRPTGRPRGQVIPDDKRLRPYYAKRGLGGGSKACIHTHRLRAERALGKPLPPGALVHHADGSTNENAPLVICQDMAYHRLLHSRMRVRAAGGNPNLDKLCCRCRRTKHFEEFPRGRGTFNRHSICKVCLRIDSARRRAAT